MRNIHPSEFSKVSYCLGSTLQTCVMCNNMLSDADVLVSITHWTSTERYPSAHHVLVNYFTHLHAPFSHFRCMSFYALLTKWLSNIVTTSTITSGNKFQIPTTPHVKQNFPHKVPFTLLSLILNPWTLIFDTPTMGVRLWQSTLSTLTQLYIPPTDDPQPPLLQGKQSQLIQFAPITKAFHSS